MKKKTIAATIAVTLMAFSLTACGNTNVPNESADNTSEIESVTESATNSVEESETSSEASETQATDDIGETEEMETAETEETTESEETAVNDNFTTLEELWQFGDDLTMVPDADKEYFNYYKPMTPTDEMVTVITVDGVEYNIFTDWGTGFEVTPDSQVSYDGLENPTSMELYNKLVENFGRPTKGVTSDYDDMTTVLTGWVADVPGNLGISITFTSDNTYSFRFASF